MIPGSGVSEPAFVLRILAVLEALPAEVPEWRKYADKTKQVAYIKAYKTY